MTRKVRAVGACLRGAIREVGGSHLEDSCRDHLMETKQVELSADDPKAFHVERRCGDAGGLQLMEVHAFVMPINPMRGRPTDLHLEVTGHQKAVSSRHLHGGSDAGGMWSRWSRGVPRGTRIRMWRVPPPRGPQPHESEALRAEAMRWPTRYAQVHAARAVASLASQP